MSLDTPKSLGLFRAMLRIRRVSEAIEAEYPENSMPTPVHLSTGQEAVSAGVCEALSPSDMVFATHRCHGPYLAKGGDLNAMMAELFGKSGGSSGGFGGSMHLVDRAAGFMGGSAIVGGNLPIATGAALASRMKGDGRVTAVFFGDGAADQGVLYESVNFAVLKRLPIIFVMENNGFSVCSPVSARQAGPNVFLKGVDKRLLFAACIDGNDAAAVLASAERAVKRAREGEGPSFMECVTYRIAGHAGPASWDVEGYRDPKELLRWKRRCPVQRLKRRLVRQGVEEGVFSSMEEEIAAEIGAAFDFARRSPFPDPADLFLQT